MIANANDWLHNLKISVSKKLLTDSASNLSWSFETVFRLLGAIEKRYGKLTYSPISWDTSRNELERMMMDCEQAIASGHGAQLAFTTLQVRDLACYLEGKYPDADYLRVSPDLAALIYELNQLDPIVKACVVIDCIDQAFCLHPDLLELNFFPVLNSVSDRIGQIFQQELPKLDDAGRRQIAEALFPQLWRIDR